MVERRLTGEPLAWITGTALFCGLWIGVTPGTYVPRPHTEPVARCAANLLSPNGSAIDLCTGSGAVAAFLQSRHPEARIVATDLSSSAVDCACANGVDARCGDLFDPVRANFHQNTDVVTAVVPYVPHETLHTLQRDTFTFETALAYDGGPEGLDVLRRVITLAPEYLKTGGHIVLELGPGQPDRLQPDLRQHGFDSVEQIVDDDGDLRGLSARFWTRQVFPG